MVGNSKEQKAGVTTLISNKVAFHTQRMIKDEVRHFMMMNLTRKIESFLTWMHLSDLSCSLLLQCRQFVQSFISPWAFIRPHRSSFSPQQPVPSYDSL